MKRFSPFWLLLLIVFTFSQPADSAMRVLEKAPDFTLTDIDGNSHTLSDYTGQYVVLEWTNPDCPFVRKHYDSKNMQGLQKKYTGQGVKWLSIASSASGKQGHYPSEEWKTILADRGASPTALLLDPDGSVGRMYNAKTTPHMFVIGPDGNILYQGAIDSKSGWDPKEIPEATNYVAAALDNAMAGKPVEPNLTKPYGCSVKY